jgi:fluoride exporter
VQELMLVALGGAIGSVARVITSGFALRLLAPGFPWGTVAVNLVGSFAFGVIVGIASNRGGVTVNERALLLSGLLGGFTTFSAFSFDNVELLNAGFPGRAVVNIVGQVVLGALALWVGMQLTMGQR